MSERSEQFNSKGVKYLNEKNYVSAVKYFVEAVRLDGNLNASYNLGYCFFNGYGVNKNYEQALKYFNIFRNLKGNVANNAMYLSGLIYDNGGYGIKGNKNLAKQFYNKAAESGHPWAMLQFGRLLQLEQDYVNARKCIQMAMKSGADDYSLQAEGKKLLKWNTVGRFCK